VHSHMFNPLEKTILELAHALDSGETTSEALVEFYLDRIEQYDRNGPMLNSIIFINPDAGKQAAKIDRERKNGIKKGPLYGIPLLIKDNINTKDMPTTSGCAALASFYPGSDAFVIKKLREAGTILLAKTTLSEFTKHGLTVGSLAGQTRNPYDLTRTPGGSSGGTGVAVAANFGAGGLGSDTVNSVRSPASACNLVGLRPTVGLWSRTGFVPMSDIQDSGGPIGRTVEDTAILLEICQGFDPDDKASATQVSTSGRSYTDCLKPDGLKGRRIGILRTNFGSDPNVLAVMDESMRLMYNSGAQLIDLNIPDFDSGSIFRRCDVQIFETAPLLNRYFTEYDAPVKSLAELVEMGVLHESVQPLLQECVNIENPLNHPEYFVRLVNIMRLREKAYYVMAKDSLDAICYPHQQIPVEKIGTNSQAGRNGIFASVIGFPAITLPGGFSASNIDAPIGVPVGIEFLGRPWNEPLLIEIAYAFEQASHSRRLSPIVDNIT
jgi:Asp-tRNA(Asn)/Glu-tRNA(Gln) amidotransferase A subunit family amidase